MKKIMLLCFVALIGWGSATAQEEQNDPRAKKILDRLSTKYDGFKSLEANVELKIEIPESDAEIIKGKMVQSDEKYRIEMGENVILCDGESLWTVMKQNETVQLSDASAMDESEDNLMMSPKDLMKIYKSDKFLYALTFEGTEKGKTIQQIEFKPLDSDSEYVKMRVTVDKKSQTASRIKIFSRDGSRYTLKINNIKGNKSYASSYFQYDDSICPSCEVEDIRID